MKTVLVAGSKNLTGDVEAKRNLARRLGELIGTDASLRLLTGGAVGSGDGETTGGVDFMAALGASKAAGDEAAERRLLTIQPRDRNAADLFAFGTVRRARGRTTPARRFELVSGADAVVTIEGEAGTPKIIEYAIAAAKPVLPVACTGGASERAWDQDQYGAELRAILDKLGLGSRQQALFDGLDAAEEVAKTCYEVVKRLLKPKCFVVMPFREKHSGWLYEQVLERVLLDEGFEPVRADAIVGSQLILEDVFSEIGEAALIIADLTGCNPNVLYELGVAHGRGKQTILVCEQQDDHDIESLLPFDLRSFRVLPFDPYATDVFEAALRRWLSHNLDSMSA